MTDSNGHVTYELALLQFRPDTTSEELLNVGAVGFSAESSALAVEITDRYSRLKAVYPDLDGMAFRSLARGLKARGSAVARDFNKHQRRLATDSAGIGDLLDQIVPPGSSNFMWSSVRYGVCEDVKQRVREVFEEYVGRFERTSVRDRVDDERLWRLVTDRPEIKPLLQHVARGTTLASQDYSYEFRASWVNGRVQVAEPISLDYMKPGDMVEQAVRWKGIVDLLAEDNDFRLTAVVTDPPRDDDRAIDKYERAMALLRKIPNVRTVIPASQAARLGELVRGDLHLTP